MNIGSKALFTSSRSAGNLKSCLTRRRRIPARWESTRLDPEREDLQAGDTVYQRINPAQVWTVLNREGESGLWSCRNSRGVTHEYFEYELQRIDQQLTLQALWEREVLGKRGSTLRATVLQVSRGYGYIVVLLSTGRAVMLYQEDLCDWFRVTRGAER